MLLLIPTVILLTVSFFVLVTVNKVEDKALKIFGWVVSVLLWVVAALIFSTVLSLTSQGSPCGNYANSGLCQLNRAPDWRSDPHHSMMGGMMGGSDKQMKCPGMQGMKNMPGTMPAAEPVDKK
jgi:hypothetical protein